ncbi:MAG: thioredoxin family protein [Erythrobacter sp.]|nr:thioredoxin family protein [Erythrobacter sp.]
MNKTSHAVTFLLIAVLLMFAITNVISMVRGPADTPSLFSDGYTLEQAAQMSEQQGKPMLVLATADWCPPCQALKRGPFQDPELIRMVEASAIPVYLDEAKHMSEMRMLGVRSFPTTMIVQGGEVLAAIEGGGRNYKSELRARLAPSE